MEIQWKSLPPLPPLPPLLFLGTSQRLLVSLASGDSQALGQNSLASAGPCARVKDPWLAHELGNNLVTQVAGPRDVAICFLAHVPQGVHLVLEVLELPGRLVLRCLDFFEDFGYLLGVLGLFLEGSGHVLRLVALTLEQLDQLGVQPQQAHVAALERHLEAGSVEALEAGMLLAGSWTLVPNWLRMCY